MDDIDLRNFYSQLLVGRLPYGSGDPVKVVIHHVFGLLGTKRLHMWVHAHEGYVYFCAIESKWMASIPSYAVPFVGAMPGRPGHQGDGVYVLESSMYAAALILEGGSVRFLSNSPDVLQDYLSSVELPVIRLSPDQGEPLHSVPEAIFGLSEKFAGVLMKASLGVAMLSTLVFVGVNAAQLFKPNDEEIGLTLKSVENNLNKELHKLNVQQPLARQIARIQKVSATVVRAGGWIESYTLKNESTEAFELILPSWVSPDYVDALGRDVVTDLRDMEGLLRVRKTVKEPVK